MVGFVSRGTVRKLLDLRDRPRATVVFRSGWDWVGGLSVLLGFQTRIGAGLLVIFLVPVTVMMHNFWASTDPLTHQIERAMFLKNLTMLGGALIISYFGAGPLSLDALFKVRDHSSTQLASESSSQR